MQLRSKIWVQALIAICRSQSAHAVVVRHGDDDAGALFVKVLTEFRMARLYGPAPAGYQNPSPGRVLAPVFEPADRQEFEIDEHLSAQQNFDPDLWIVEIENCRDLDTLHEWIVSGAVSANDVPSA